MKTPVTNTNDPAVERNISRSDMDIVIAVLDKIPELNEVPAQLDTIQALEASVVDKAGEVATNTLIVQSETATTVSNAASALASKNAAELSEINASNSANSASISKDNALASAVSANGSAQSALASKDSANLSAVSASASASVATTKASEASASATSASTSANTATTQAGIATTKANEASTSASNALTSETNADASEVMAHKWAQEAEDVIVTGTLGIDDEYSAYHWAQKAQAAVGGNIYLGSLYDVDTVGIVDGGIITYNQSTGRYAPYDFRHNPYIGLNTTSGMTAGVGQFAWNATEGTADLGLPNGVTLQLGQENNRLVRNNTASTILNGTVVVATGSIGASGRITVAPCGGTSNDVHAIYGVTTQDILAGEDGFITIDGKVRLINTSGSSVGETWSDGDVLYVKPNDNGRLTNVVPSIGELKVSIAKVIRAHATTGVLEVRTLSVLDENAYEPRNTNIQSHITDTANPHGVTKLQIGLGNAEDTADNVKNVLSATKWTTARLFNGVSVDGTANVTIPLSITQKSDAVEYTIPFVSTAVASYKSIYTDSAVNITYNPSTNNLTVPNFTGALTGNATTASALQTGRTIGMTGDVTWTSASFNGSDNVTGTATLATITDSGTGTFKKITTNTKGLVTGTQSVTQSDITGLLGAGSISNTMLANSAVANLSGVNTGDQTDITGNAGTADRLNITELGGAVDLNTITTTGLYSQASTAQATSGTNYPIPQAGLLEVFNYASGGMIHQRYWQYNSNNTWMRSKYNTAAWNPWTFAGATTTVDSGYTGTVLYNNATPLAGAFSGGTTAPLAVGNRLNYSGYFYPTYINLSASADTAVASSHYFVETAYDGYVRPKTLANVRAEIITKAALLSADPYYFTSGIGTSGIAATTHYPIFPAGSDTLTLGVGTYKVKLCMIATVATSTVSSPLNISIRGAGTAVGTHYGMLRNQPVNNGSPIQSLYSATNISSNLTMTATSAVAGRTYQIDVDIIMNITTAGTIIPAYTWSAALTSGVVTLSAANYIIIDKMAETSVTTAGGWV